jgi:hypothetical protein
MIQFLKNLKNLFLYKFKYFFFPSIDKNNDINFFIVKELRSSGIYVDHNFIDKNESAKNLINFYNEKIDKNLLCEFIKKSCRNDKKASYKIKITNFFDKQLLLNFAEDIFFKENIQQYFGFEPYLREINVAADIKNHFSKQPIFTQNFHRDADDIKLVKIFFYLTDVDEENGPFQFLSETHKDPWNNPRSFAEKDILIKFNTKKLVSCIGKQGTLVIADTNGLHRGLILKKNYRYMLTAMYTSQKPYFGKLKEIIQ